PPQPRSSLPRHRPPAGLTRGPPRSWRRGPAAAPWASSSAPAVQREAAAAAAPAAPRAATATSDADLEELARKLYEPIRSRLRTELLIDRERAGMIAESAQDQEDRHRGPSPGSGGRQPVDRQIGAKSKALPGTR